MAVTVSGREIGGQRCIQDGLVCHYDAGNYNSMLSDGPALYWNDLSDSNCNLVRQGSPYTPLTTIDGVKCLEFNGSGYWQSLSNEDNVDFTDDMTLEIWYYWEGRLATRKTIFEKAGNTYNSYEQEVAITIEETGNGRDASLYRRYNSYDYMYTSGNCFTDDGWNHIVFTAETDGINADGDVYVNGSATSVASYSDRSNSSITAAGAVKIGTGYAGTMATDAGAIAIVRGYDRMLSDEERLYNFNVERGRFGI